MALRDRRSECEALDRLLKAVRSGESRALVVRGEPGVGKTALLEHLVERASGCRVARASGVQSEMELPFAGLHQLCAPMLDELAHLPGPQREALTITFGLSNGDPPGRLLVGLAVLGLLAEVAREQPLVCVVDDVQWLDRASAQALMFAARRLGAESVAMVFASREPGEEQESDEEESTGLQELVVGGLPDEDARALLGSALPGPVDARVLDRIVGEARGNPLALLELPRGLTPAELTGGFGLPTTMPLPKRIEESFRRQLAPLPADSRELLVIAAAEPLGDPVLIWRAAQWLGIGHEAAAPATTAGLIEIGAQVRFRHPLLRSAVHRAATVEEWRYAHRALAESIDPDTDPDRRAWHRAQAAAGPDEDVAAELERSAGRAQSRGGRVAAAAFLERATHLTLHPQRRAERALAAAQAKHQAGAPDTALELLSAASAGPLDPLQRVRSELLRAQIAFTVSRGRDAPSLLLRAAEQLEPLDVQLARETYLDALDAAIFAGPLAGSSGLQETAAAARSAPPSQSPSRAPDLLLDGLAVGYTDGFAAGIPTLKRALVAFRCPDVSEEEGLRWLWLTCRVARALWDEEAWEAIVTRFLELARETGALSVLPLALSARTLAHVFAGELDAAEALGDELHGVTEATGSPFVPYGALMLAAWRGREDEATDLIETVLDEAVSRGEGLGLTVTGLAAAVLNNGFGRYEEAMAAAERAGEHPEELNASTAWALVELVEAATRIGMPERADGALQQIAKSTRASATDWGLGIEARCRALTSDGYAAERAYREAIERLGRTRIRGELARAHLLYGEWLRREGRRLDAREQLRTAYEMFTATGMEAFARRAERELGATGETVRRRPVEIGGELTAQEAQVARLVREGLTNPEIGARLFISPRTVEYHLHKIFGKLNITSRRQLRR
ncbi:helix-turn-helix transcriptional regulator [Pseudonocardia sp. CA-142604]|uniref:helix-turn-helix transcriptional regulator n=1 Tax=Pseudonocardia sp. CA-142604 TaxID=3240024 RepID=UPI003D9294C1